MEYKNGDRIEPWSTPVLGQKAGESTPDDGSINSVISRLDIQERQNRRFTMMIDSMLSTELIQTEGLIQSTTTMTEAALDWGEWWSRVFKSCLQAQFKELS
ncbi:hypothetical protein G6F55_013665 [Rhizopus delemar]|nr:hypothetical protein G6F55_013665 [Rhizopus delemar]